MRTLPADGIRIIFCMTMLCWESAHMVAGRPSFIREFTGIWRQPGRSCSQRHSNRCLPPGRRSHPVRPRFTRAGHRSAGCRSCRRFRHDSAVSAVSLCGAWNRPR